MSSQPPKDFLALSHGHEWVNFYESFDKLVQDHLSRSSELLRKAMSLPEVADREVAQVRDDLEARLTSEREQNRAMLSTLRDEVGKSHQAVSTLAAMVGTLMADLEQLSQNVEAAITRSDEIVAQAPMVSDETAAAQVPNGTTHLDQVETEAAPAQEWVAEVTGEESAEVGDAEASLSWDELASEVDAADADANDSEIDLNALAEAEQHVDPSAEANASGGESTPEERSRPHWLSMSRTSNNN